MKRKIAKLLIVSMLMGVLMNANVFAAILDPSIPCDFAGLSLNTDGTATFTPPNYTVDAMINGHLASVSQWKKFEAKLLKRQTVVDGGNTKYRYAETGSAKSCKADEREVELKFSSTGNYQFQIRGYNLEGNYSYWVWISGNAASGGKISDYTTYEGLPIGEDDIGIDSGNGSGSGSGSGYGPGTVTTGNLPNGYQYAVIGPNGEILGYYGNTSNYQYQTGYQNTQQYLGPGYSNNQQGAGQTLYPNTGISNYQQVESPYTYAGVSANQATQYAQQGNAQVNPNYYNGGTITGGGANQYVTPQITQGLEIGWHVDNNGRFYYQGNGAVLKGTWYLIDGNYYRFGDNGYLLANQWYKDNTTGYWYFLAGDGKMLTGWQCLNGTWYYFKPQNGNGYGTMYANTTLFIQDPQWGSGNYAFDTNGAMVRNAWYGGHYYGNDGNRTN